MRPIAHPTAALLALTILLGLLFTSIPLAIYGLILLADPEVRQRFEAADRQI